MSEREYARHAGLSRAAIQKAKLADRLVMYADGSIDPAGSDTRRAARLVELDPKYCDVIIRRWQDETGETATHEDGRAFDDVVDSSGNY